jgi:hypothetical protein
VQVRPAQLERVEWQIRVAVALDEVMLELIRRADEQFREVPTRTATVGIEARRPRRFAGLGSTLPRVAPSNTSARGRALYIRTCAACHRNPFPPPQRCNTP